MHVYIYIFIDAYFNCVVGVSDECHFLRKGLYIGFSWIRMIRMLHIYFFLLFIAFFFNSFISII